MSHSFSQAGWDFPWWITMVIIGAVNYVVAIFLFRKSMKQGKQEPNNAQYFLLLRVLGLVFITVSFYRTIFVSSYPNRLAWFDTIFNSPFVIRSLAFFAELSFIGVIAVVLKRFSNEVLYDQKYTLITKLPFVSFGCIALAQFFAYGGLIGQSLTQFAIEETLWAVAFLCIVPIIIVGFKEMKHQQLTEKSYKTFLRIMMIWCCGYLTFQCFFALPFMHYADLAQDIGRIVPPDALAQSIFNFTATRDFDKWGGLGFFIWHSGYFSICAWMVLYFMTAPRKQNPSNISQVSFEQLNN